MTVSRGFPARVLLLAGVRLVRPQSNEDAFGPGRVEEIYPTGGPVRGDTSITVYGSGLAGVECFFGITIPGKMAPQRSTCKSSETAWDYGRRCVCTTPPAPRPTTTVVEMSDQGSLEATTVFTGDYEAGPVPVRAVGQFGHAWAPWDTLFEYYLINTAVKVTSIEPTAGNPQSETVVTVRGRGFIDYGGIFCSYPGPHWDHTMKPEDPAYPYQDFTSPATVISSELLLCHLAPAVNNTSPVFVEVCINGHPDRASLARREQRDSFCTASLQRFVYADLSNLTIWNASVISGPISGGTEVTTPPHPSPSHPIPSHATPHHATPSPPRPYHPNPSHPDPSHLPHPTCTPSLHPAPPPPYSTSLHLYPSPPQPLPTPGDYRGEGGRRPRG